MAGQKFDQTMRVAGVRIATGNTAIDGTGSLTSLVTGAAGQTRVTSVQITPIATITDGHIAFFLYDGTNNRLLGIFPVQAWTVTLPVKPPPSWVWVPPSGEVLLPTTSYILKACPYNSESFDLIPKGADLA